jgi:sugar phosphate isomerase/epimerase
MKKISLVHFIQWEKVPDEQLDSTFAELKDMGADNIVLHPCWWIRDEKEGSFLKKIYEKMIANGMTGTACHGLWGKDYDLNCPDEARRKQITSTHRRFMNSVADMGSLTYTVHLGDRRPGCSKDFLYGQVRKTLDTLLPDAEKSGIKIALENMIDYDLSHEIAALAAEYNHPALGICLDTGHAHVGEDLKAAVENTAPYLVTCHMHDNDGSGDQHLPAGCGTTDWQYLTTALKACPKIINAETEAGDCEGLSRASIWEMFKKHWEMSE